MLGSWALSFSFSRIGTLSGWSLAVNFSVGDKNYVKMLFNNGAD